MCLYTLQLLEYCTYIHIICKRIGNTVGFLIYIAEEEPHGHNDDEDEEGHNSDPLQDFYKIDSNNTLSTISSHNNNTTTTNKFPPATPANITNETKKGYNYDSSDTLNYSSVVDDHNVNDNSTNKEKFSLQINIGMVRVIMYCALSIASILT